MKRTTRLVAVAGLVGALTLGTAGVVVAAGAAGHGPASVLSSLVEDGTLTQAQADKVSAALEAGREQHRQQMEERREQMQKVITSTLGISEAELESARESGKTLNELAGDKADQLQAAMVAQIKEQTAKAVSEGKLTAEQANEINQRAEEHVSEMMAGEHRGFGPGGPGGPGGPPPFGDRDEAQAPGA